MTVRDLLDRLKDMSPDAVVVLRDDMGDEYSKLTEVVEGVFVPDSRGYEWFGQFFNKDASNQALSSQEQIAVALIQGM